MSTSKQLHIGLSLTAARLMAGQPSSDDTKAGHDTIGIYVELAQAAERAKLDFVFKPDTVQYNSAMAAGSPAIVGLDPTILLAVLACATRKIGLVTTMSSSFTPPYIAARQIQSLQWVSNGRAGLNIVTSIEGAENFGEAGMPPTEIRYRKAAEFTGLLAQLRESYPVEAFTGAASCSAIDYHGDFFSVKGPLNVPAHPAGPPPLLQAGASDAGRNFAAAVADATFAAAPDRQASIELRTDLRRRAEGHGRSPDAVRALPGLYFFLAETREEAWALHEHAHAHLTPEHRRKSVQTILGLDLSDLLPADRVTPEMLPPLEAAVRSRTHADLLRRFIDASRPTVSELLSRPEVVGSAHWVSVGTVDDVLGDIVDWFEADAMDGFIAIPGGSITSLNLFLERLIPALVGRGLFRSDYEGSTLREHFRVSAKT